MYFLGIDLGSSSVKIALVDQATGKALSVLQEPSEEMAILAPNPNWAEQDPEDWWRLTCKGIKRTIKENQIKRDSIRGIGIAYQMHGLVLVDKNGKCLRNSIIWCDSRAVEIGETAYRNLGKTFCDSELLNSPANFTASKLRWVQENEPELYRKINKFMLPGDYLAFRLSGETSTTVSGLSEGIFWNFKRGTIARELLDYYHIADGLVPDMVDTFSLQAKVSKIGADESGLMEGTPILYRAGDQPNNALALNVFHPGEIAATGGTSGVVYAVTDDHSVMHCDKVNNFAHVNYSPNTKNIGKLLCINGAGIQYRWLHNNLAVRNYEEMNQLANGVAIGADGVRLIPFGNGAERMFSNKTVGARIMDIDLNRHNKGHLCRAALEGIAFSFVYGFEIMMADGIEPSSIKAGNDNLFRSSIFAETIASLIGQPIEIYNTTGAVGAARACILNAGDYETFSSFMKDDHVNTFSPKQNKTYQDAYASWKIQLEITLKSKN